MTNPRRPHTSPSAAARQPAGAGRREAGKAERRARIIDAARSLIRETGDAGLSMRVLAERAGVSPATPYNLFGSKRAILVTVLEDLRGFDKAFSVSGGLAPFPRILRAAELAVSYYEKDPDFYRALWTTILRSGAAEDRSAIFNPKREAFWLALLSDALQAGHLPADTHLQTLQRMLDHAFRGTMLHWALGELAAESLQPAVGYAYALALRGAATDAGRATLDAPLARAQALLARMPAAGPAG